MSSYDVTPGNPNGKQVFQAKLKEILSKVKKVASKIFDKAKTFAPTNKAASVGIVAGISVLAIGIPIAVSVTRPKPTAEQTLTAEQASVFEGALTGAKAALKKTIDDADVNYTLTQEIKVEMVLSGEADGGFGRSVMAYTMTATFKIEFGKFHAVMRNAMSTFDEMFDEAGNVVYSEYEYEVLDYNEVYFWKDGEEYYIAGRFNETDEFVVTDINSTFGETSEKYLYGDPLEGVLFGSMQKYFKYSGGKYALIDGKK
jgi:hypothetical protein